jgi:hypothetical protein
MGRTLCLLSLLVFPFYSVWSQNPIPNPGFESWTGNEPDEWLTSNIPEESVRNITRSSPGYQSLFALKGEVIEAPGYPDIPYLPLFESDTRDLGFPVEERFPFLAFYHRFSPRSAEDFLSVTISFLDPDGSVFGGGSVEISEPQDSFTPYLLPLEYREGQPSKAIISMTVGNRGDTGLPTIGTQYLVDEFSLLRLTEPGRSGTPIEPSDNRTSVVLYGNQLEISFDSPRDNFYTIHLWDATAKRITEIFKGALPAGPQNLKFDRPSLFEDIHYCTVGTKEPRPDLSIFRVQSGKTIK